MFFRYRGFRSKDSASLARYIFNENGGDEQPVPDIKAPKTPTEAHNEYEKFQLETVELNNKRQLQRAMAIENKRLQRKKNNQKFTLIETQEKWKHEKRKLDQMRQENAQWKREQQEYDAKKQAYWGNQADISADPDDYDFEASRKPYEVKWDSNGRRIKIYSNKDPSNNNGRINGEGLKTTHGISTEKNNKKPSQNKLNTNQSKKLNIVNKSTGIIAKTKFSNTQPDEKSKVSTKRNICVTKQLDESQTLQHSEQLTEKCVSKQVTDQTSSLALTNIDEQSNNNKDKGDSNKQVVNENVNSTLPVLPQPPLVNVKQDITVSDNMKREALGDVTLGKMNTTNLKRINNGTTGEEKQSKNAQSNVQQQTKCKHPPAGIPLNEIFSKHTGNTSGQIKSNHGPQKQNSASQINKKRTEHVPIPRSKRLSIIQELDE